MRRQVEVVSGNPWVQSPDRGAERSEQESTPAATRVTPVLPALAPQAASVAAPRQGFPRRGVDLTGPPVSVWWVGAHGGAGESTLEQLLEGSRANGHAWPDTGERAAPPPVIVVARTNARGLRAAQLAATEWASGSVAVQLHGLVLIADAPGRTPKPLRDFAQVVAGAFPRVWRLPWVEAWRLGEPVSPETTPKAVSDLLEELRTTIAGQNEIPSA
jgi:hypothetical protein